MQTKERLCPTCTPYVSLELLSIQHTENSISPYEAPIASHFYRPGASHPQSYFTLKDGETAVEAKLANTWLITWHTRGSC